MSETTRHEPTRLVPSSSLSVVGRRWRSVAIVTGAAFAVTVWGQGGEAAGVLERVQVEQPRPHAPGSYRPLWVDGGVVRVDCDHALIVCDDEDA